MKVFRRPQSLYRSFTYNPRHLPCRYASTAADDPLRILFCGSDEFSVASLQALHQEHLDRPDTIESIDVVCRPGKRVGRGLKNVREVHIEGVAKELGLPVHNIDTFTRWIPPRPQDKPINLIIAVSFGLKVPPRILGGARFGGLNVHPSLLPDFRGPAPLHHTLLAGCERTGVTLQTLHPEHFDQGMILAQTPFPGFEIPEANDCTVPQLLELVAPKGAQVLVRGIRDRLYVPPLKDVGWFRETDDVDKLRHAPKITTEDKHIDWDSWTAEDILRRTRIISPLWNMATCKEYSARQKSVKRDEKRIIWTKGFQPFAEIADPDRISGVPFADWQSYGAHLLVKTCDGKLLKISDATVEGENSLPAWLAATRASMVAVQDRSFIGSFLEKLR